MAAARLTLGCLKQRDYPHRCRTDDQCQTPDRIWAQSVSPVFTMALPVIEAALSLKRLSSKFKFINDSFAACGCGLNSKPRPRRNCSRGTGVVTGCGATPPNRSGPHLACAGSLIAFNAAAKGTSLQDQCRRWATANFSKAQHSRCSTPDTASQDFRHRLIEAPPDAASLCAQTNAGL
jgi:hypothetical protein